MKTKKQIPDVIHATVHDLFRKYICVGGMPEAVNTFLETHDLNQVREIQLQILNGYESDFGTHLNDDNEVIVDKFAKARITEYFKSIPIQLAKENKKFQYSILKEKGSARDYKDAIEWLEDAGIIARCYNLATLEMPLNMFLNESIFKVYMKDTGLFIAMLDYGVSRLILSGDLGTGKGAIYENIVADAFSKNGRKLYYYKKNSGLEIDFITYYNDRINLVEVKAVSGNVKSSRQILVDNEHYSNINSCIKLSSQNIGCVNNIYTIPYYLTFLIQD